MSNWKRKTYPKTYSGKLKNLTKFVPRPRAESKDEDEAVKVQSSLLKEMNEREDSSAQFLIPPTEFPKKPQDLRVQFLEPRTPRKRPGINDRREAEGSAHYWPAAESVGQQRRKAVCVAIEKSVVLRSGYSLYQSRKALVVSRTLDERFSVF